MHSKESANFRVATRKLSFVATWMNSAAIRPCGRDLAELFKSTAWA